MAANTDWEKIEAEYRGGQLSTREIARQHGVSHTAIAKKAKAEGWEKDLTNKVRKLASAKLSRDEVSTEVASRKARTEAETVEAQAARVVEVVRQHRHVIGRGRDLTLDELDATTSHVGDLEEMIEAETATDTNSMRRNAMLKAIALPSRAGVIKDLSAAAKNWVVLERQAFSLEDAPLGTESNPVRVVTATMTAKEAADAYSATLHDQG